MVFKRTFLILVGVACFSAPIAAHAQKHSHPRDYFARVSVEPEIAPAAEAHKPMDTRPDCFVSNSPVEVTRGIRHWTGKCN